MVNLITQKIAIKKKKSLSDLTEEELVRIATEGFRREREKLIAKGIIKKRKMIKIVIFKSDKCFFVKR